MKDTQATKTFERMMGWGGLRILIFHSTSACGSIEDIGAAS